MADACRLERRDVDLKTSRRGFVFLFFKSNGVRFRGVTGVSFRCLAEREKREARVHEVCGVSSRLSSHSERDLPCLSLFCIFPMRFQDPKNRRFELRARRVGGGGAGARRPRPTCRRRTRTRVRSRWWRRTLARPPSHAAFCARKDIYIYIYISFWQDEGKRERALKTSSSSPSSSAQRARERLRTSDFVEVVPRLLSPR